MTIKGTHVIGLPVISIDTGKKIDTVTDIIYDPTSRKVAALLIDEGGWFSEAKIIPMEDVRAIGKDFVTVDTENIVRKASEVSQKVANIAEAKDYLIQSKIVTENGVDLGRVNDIYFDEETGRVVQLEVSEGLGDDQESGIVQVVDINDVITVGEDALIVKSPNLVEQGINHGSSSRIEIEDTQNYSTSNLDDLKRNNSETLGDTNLNK